jgi:hypothetical protein
MICKDFEEILSDYLEKTLPEEKQKAAKQHLALCHPCRRMMEDVSWTINQCKEFPALHPPPHLKTAILEKTSLRKPLGHASEIFPFILEWKKTPFAYALSTIVLVLLVVSLLFNTTNLLKGVNKQIHQLYSSGVKLYYETEKFTEEFSALKEDFPNQIDSGIVKSINWIKKKMQKEEKKEEEKGKTRDLPSGHDFLA